MLLWAHKRDKFVFGCQYTPLYEKGIKETQNKPMETTKINWSKWNTSIPFQTQTKQNIQGFTFKLAGRQYGTSSVSGSGDLSSSPGWGAIVFQNILFSCFLIWSVCNVNDSRGKY